MTVWLSLHAKQFSGSAVAVKVEIDTVYNKSLQSWLSMYPDDSGYTQKIL